MHADRILVSADLKPSAVQPGAGSHRAAVAHIVERLSYGRSAAINTHIVKAGLIQRLLPLCLEFPHNNILQTACCEIIRQAALPRLYAVGQAHALLTRNLP